MFIFRGFTTNFGEQSFCTSVGHMQWFMGLVHLGGFDFQAGITWIFICGLQTSYCKCISFT